jgi:PAS domain S-box-containing protein
MTPQPDSTIVPHDRPIEVLMVEDDAADALIVERSLQKVFLISFRVTTVPTLTEGLQRLRTRSFDVALLDLKLPDASGMETFALLRTEAPELPLIVLTGNQDDELAARILRQGAQDYLLKDEANGPLLARAIRHAIERHRVRVELNLRTSKLAESEDTLRRARNRYFALFDRAPIGYMVFDASHSIKEVNTAAAEVFGATPAHDWDSCFYGCLGESSRGVFSLHLQRVFGGETKEVAMVHIIGHDGTPRELHFESHLLQAESDGGAQCLSLFVDLTDQMRAENRLATAASRKDRSA